MSEFLNGGGTPSIKAYEWVGTGGSHGSLDSLPVTGSDIYAIVNMVMVDSPWPYDPKAGPDDIFSAGAFFEGGIDLCNLVGIDPCFTSFMATTRSSQEVTAALQDFMIGSFFSKPQVIVNSEVRCLNGDSVTLAATVIGGQTPYSYLWSTGDTTASIKVAPDTTTSYIVVVTGDNGCDSDPDTATVAVNPLPNTNAGPDKVLTCEVTMVTLEGSSTSPGVSFLWQATGGGNIVSGDSTSGPVVDSAGTYILTVTDTITLCSSTDTVIVTIDDTLPDANAGPDKVLTCTITQVTLEGSTTSTGVTVNWVASGGGYIFSGENTLTPVVKVPGTYTLNVRDTINGCTGSDFAVVTQDTAAPDVNAGPDSVLTCTTTQLILIGFSSDTNVTFSWVASGGGNIVSPADNDTITVDAPGAYVLTVTDTVNGCEASDVAMVTMDTVAPEADAGADTALTCAITQITLMGSSTTPGITFSWTAGAGGNIVSGANTANAVVDAAATYYLMVTDTANGCTATDSVLVWLNDTAPDVDAGPDQTLTCTTLEVTLNGSSATEGVTFLWTAGTGGNIVSGADSANAVVDAAAIYYLTVTDTVNGCFATDSVNIILDDTIPNADAGPDKTLTCAVTQVTLDGSTTSTGVIVNWVASNGGFIFSGENTLTPVVKVPGTYTLNVTDTLNGCLGSDTALVFQDTASPNVNAGPDMILNCIVTEITLNGSSSTPNVTFGWVASDGGNIVSGSNSSSVVVNAAGVYTLTVTDTTNGCTASDVAIVTIDTVPPDADAGPDKELTCAITEVILTGSSETVGTSFSWIATGGGNIVSGSDSANAIVNEDGTYILTVTDTINGCTATDTVIVTRDTLAPDADAGPDMTINCMDLTVVLAASSSTPGVTFSWTAMAGGNIVSGADSANATADAAGTYILTVTDTINGCSATDTALVVTDTIVPDINGGPDTLLNCINTEVMLNASTNSVNVMICWYPKGNVVSGGHTLTPVVNTDGMFIVYAIDTINGCYSSDTVIVGIDTIPPDADAGIDTMLTCTVTEITLMSSSATPGVTFSWAAGAGGNIVSGANTANAVVDAAATYYLTVTDTINGCMAMDSVIVSIDTLVPDADAGIDTMLTCTVTEITLMGSSTTPGVTFSWAAGTGGNIVSGANTANAVVDAAATYYLTVTDTTNGCMAMDSVVITIDTIGPEVDLGNDTTLTECLPFFVLHAGNPGSQYLWSTGDTTEAISVNASGTYWVQVTDSSGCIGSDTIQVTFIIPPFIINLGPDTTICGCITLNAASGTGSVYEWCSGQAYPAITVCASGTYCVKVTNQFGCVAIDSIVVIVDSALVVDLGPDIVQAGGTVTLDAGSPGGTYLWNTGDTTQTIIVSVSGTYSVFVIDSSGCIGGDSILVTILTGIEEYAGNNMVSVYPNPNKGDFRLAFGVPYKQNVEIKLLNYLGMEIYKETLDGFSGNYNKQIDVSDFSGGIYFIRISRNGKMDTIKIAVF